MKRRQKNNFVDDVKVAQPLRHSRTSKVDMINGDGVGEDLGLVQGTTLNAIGSKFYAPMEPEPLEPGGPAPTTPTLPTAPTPTFPGGNTPFAIPPVVDAGADQQIMLPTSNATLQGSAQGTGSIGLHKEWSYVGGPNGASPQIANPNSEQTEVSNLTVPGNYTFKLYAIYYGIGGPQKPTQLNNASDTVVITVLPSATYEPPLPPPIQQPPSSEPVPADNTTIGGWDCTQLNKYLNIYNQFLSDPTLTQQTRIKYESALLFINNRINTICTPSTTPSLDVPSEPTSEPPAAPLPTIADINSMNCDQLNGLKTALVVNESAYRTDATTLQNYINTVNYVDLQFTQKCKNTTPTAPTVEIYAPGTTPYSTGVKATGSAGIGGLGGGGSSSIGATPAQQQNYKRWWWIGVVVVVGALILFKPGTKIGVPSK